MTFLDEDDDMLIVNATLVNWMPRQITENQALFLQGGRIADIGHTQDLSVRYAHAERLDVGGKLVMPGNICAHTHFYGAFARGMSIPPPAPRNFPEILSKLWWNLDKALTLDDVRLSAQVCLVDAIKHGTTTLIDHHASPNAIEGSLDQIAEAVDKSGLRAVLCYEVTDRDGEDKAQAGIAENIRFLRNLGNHPRIRGTFGLHASLTLSDETLAACVQANEPFGGGFHIHVAEHESDQENALQRSGVRVARRLQRAGILGKRTIAAHCVHVDAWEMEILRGTETWVTHQPRSNMNNAVGAAPFDEMIRGGLKLCIGNDGFSNAMFEEWKTAYLLHKVAHRDPRCANGEDIVAAGAYHNAELAEVFLGETLGVLSVGAVADIIVLDYHPFTPLTEGNLPWHILFGVESSMVTATIVAGQVLMWERRLLAMDEPAIAAEARARVPSVWARYTQLANAAASSA
ncbi:MAG: putative aminohydrolase SsnA [Anaerolineae bacterium]